MLVVALIVAALAVVAVMFSYYLVHVAQLLDDDRIP